MYHSIMCMYHCITISCALSPSLDNVGGSFTLTLDGGEHRHTSYDNHAGVQAMYAVLGRQSKVCTISDRCRWCAETRCNAAESTPHR